MHTTPQPEWLIEEPYVDVDLGVLRSGKEAQIDVIERIGEDGRGCLLARKRYVPRLVGRKGELEALGLQRASAFRNDVEYREGRQFRKSRDRRAVEAMSAYGKRLLQSRWTGHEHEVMSRLWQAGLDVPYPVSFVDDVFVMEYAGSTDGAAPQLARGRLTAGEVASALDQVVAGLHLLVATGWVHGDLSAYNLLWWQGRVVFIDFPQAVDLAANPQGIEYLHRDVVNICSWFAGRGVDIDGEEVFADVLGSWSP
ncbi:MAG: RIO1 family regulatory kinase/ATPase [Acidimicrobiales bacterium]